MRKTLLSLALAAMAAGNAYSMYLVGQPAGEWNPAIGIEMTETEAGWQWSGSIASSDYFAFATELDPSGDWTNFNANYRLSPSQDGTEAAEGEYDLHLGAPDTAFKGCGADCTLLVTKTGDSYKLTVTVNGDTPETPTEDTWSLIGGFTDWNVDIDLIKLHDDMWTVNVPEIDGGFKFRANHSWDLNLGGTAESAEIIQDGMYASEQNGYDFNISDGKNVTFFLQPAAKQLTVKHNCGAATPLALRGGMNGWSWDPMYCLTETSNAGVYTVTIENYEAGTAFKLSDNGWVQQYTSQNKTMVANQDYELTVNDGSSSDMAFAESYAVLTIVLDTNNNTLNATTGGTAVDSLIATDAAPVYYNLHGVKVDNPEHGIFIRMSNGQASKVRK